MSQHVDVEHVALPYLVQTGEEHAVGAVRMRGDHRMRPLAADRQARPVQVARTHVQRVLSRAMVDGQVDVDLRHADARHRAQRVRLQQFVVFRILLTVEIVIRLAADRIDAPAKHALPALQQEPVVFDRPLHHRVA